MPRLTGVAVVALLPLFVACGGVDESPGAAVGATRWQVDSAPIFDLADTDANDNVLIGFAEGVTRLPDGEVLVADRGLFSLRWFSPDGELVKSVGREGMGPYEFTYIAEMYRCGTSVYIEDLGRGDMLQRFSLGGESLPPVSIVSADKRNPYTSACNSDGRWLSNGWGEEAATGELGRQRFFVPYWISDSAGTQQALLGTLPGSERYMEPLGSGPLPLGKQPVLGLGRTRAYVGLADSFAVQVYALDGTPVGTLRDAGTDLRTTDQDIARYKYHDTVAQSALDKRGSVLAWERVPFAPTIPAYDALLVDSEEHIWVRRFPRETGGTVEWVVFNPAGTREATATVNESLEVHEIGVDYIAGIEVDPVEGRQTVRVYTLRRAEQATHYRERFPAGSAFTRTLSAERRHTAACAVMSLHGSVILPHSSRIWT